MSRIMEYITPEERTQAMKFGAYQRLSEAGVPFARIDGLVKQALEMPSASGVAKTVIALSVLTGIPFGIAAHVIGNRINRARGHEKELTTEAGYYRNATEQMQRGLEAANASS